MVKITQAEQENDEHPGFFIAFFRKSRKLNDDDFSVAPSLEVAMRSIVAHKFADVYQKGKKVRLLVF